MRGEGGTWREQQHVIVVGSDKGADRDNAIPPGRFSITTGWPQRAPSRSAIRRAPMSVPEPGPSGRRNFTGRCGQLCANAVPLAHNRARTIPTSAITLLAYAGSLRPFRSVGILVTAT